MALSVFLWKLFIRILEKYSFRMTCNGECSFAGNIWAWSVSCIWCPAQTNLTFLLQKVTHRLLGGSQRCWLFSLISLFNILSGKSSCLGCLRQRSVLAGSISVGHAPSCSARAEGNWPVLMGLAALGEWLDLITLEVFFNLSDLVVL